jgi:hypothetical protein
VISGIWECCSEEENIQILDRGKPNVGGENETARNL